MPLYIYIYIYIYIYVHIIHINCTKHCIDICVHFGHLFSFSIRYDLRPFFSFSLSRSLAIINVLVNSAQHGRVNASYSGWTVSNHVFFRLFKDRFMTFYLEYLIPLWTLTDCHVYFRWDPSTVTVDCVLISALRTEEYGNSYAYRITNPVIIHSMMQHSAASILSHHNSRAILE